MDFSKEIRFQTARSGGKGGQNVNKVETMVEGYWQIHSSKLFTTEQKELMATKLSNKINEEGELLVKSQTERTQLGNKQQVIKKMHLLVEKALIVPKSRKKSKPSKASVAKRLDSKKKKGETKQSRKKIVL